jgi:hypothetical protein
MLVPHSIVQAKRPSSRVTGTPSQREKTPGSVKAANVTGWLVLTSVLATTTGLVQTLDAARSGASSALIHLLGLSRAPCRPRSESWRAR